MLVGILFETAAAWHGGMNSALYSLLSTEIIHNKEHRLQLLRELDDEINGDGLQQAELEAELTALKMLRNFVESAPLGVTLSYALISIDGYCLKSNSREFILIR